MNGRALFGTVLGLVGAPTAAVFAASLCLGPSDLSNVNGTVDCDVGQQLIHSNGFTGFALVLEDLCTNVDVGYGYSSQFDYEWSISSSATESWRNVGPVPADGWLYLWLTTTWIDGFWAAEFRFTGSLNPVAFEPLNGVSYLDISGVEFPDVLLRADCEGASFLAGRVQVEIPTPVDGGSWGRTKVLYR